MAFELSQLRVDLLENTAALTLHDKVRNDTVYVTVHVAGQEEALWLRCQFAAKEAARHALEQALKAL